MSPKEIKIYLFYYLQKLKNSIKIQQNLNFALMLILKERTVAYER